jgi:hypothetical protein
MSAPTPSCGGTDMTRIPLAIIVLVLALAAASGGHLVWGDSAPSADYVVWGN